MSFGRFGRVRGFSHFANAANFSFFMSRGRLTRRMYFVLAERPLGGFVEQQTPGVAALASTFANLQTAGTLDDEKLQDALMLSLASLDVALLQSSVCGILSTHNFCLAFDYMKPTRQISNSH